MSARARTVLPWIAENDPLPDPRLAMREPNGLLAAGAGLAPGRLLEAYRHGIFPWYSEGQPVLWWSPDPRMVLYLDEFRLHRSLAKLIRRHRSPPADSPQRLWQVCLNRDFEAVVRACAEPRDEDAGTWITAEILHAYVGLHRLGYAHSVEVRQDGALIGGLYGVAIGCMFYGESMFTKVSGASKVALAALVATLLRHGFRMLDCQQDTRHLASLGARPISRQAFLEEIARLTRQPGPDWRALAIELPDV